MLSILSLSLFFLAGCDKMKEVQNSITPNALPTLTAEKSDFQTTEKTGKFVINPQFSGASNFSEGLAAILIGDAKTGKWGFIDKNIKFIINPQFSGASNFSEGLAAVLIGDPETGTWGFIDKDGKMVINPQFSIASQFSDGLAAVLIGDAKTGTWGFINKQGKMVVNPQFSNASQFSDGLAAVLIGDAKTGKWGYIDKQGKMVVNPQFEKVGLFTEGLAAVQIGDKKTGTWGFIDKQGKMLINPQFILANQFSEGLAAVKIKGFRQSKYHAGMYVEGNNNIRAISTLYETKNFHASPEVFQNIAYGLLRVAFNTTKVAEKITRTKSSFDYLYLRIEFNKISLSWGKGTPNILELSTSDKYVVATWDFPNPNLNVNGIAVEMINLITSEFKKNDGADARKMDQAAKALRSYSFETLSIGLIPDLKSGNYELETDLERSISNIDALLNPDQKSFKNGFISKESIDELFTWGFVDKNSKIIINPSFDFVGKFSHGLAPMQVDGKWGFIDKNGKIIIEPNLDSAFQFSEKLAPVRADGKWGYISR